MLSLRQILALAVFASASLAFGSEPTRFSKTLPADEFSALELGRLSSDQLAVLDALVRRDVARAAFVSKTPRPPRFSERLTLDERRNAGLDRFAPEKLVQLDRRIEQLVTPKPPLASAASASAATGGYSVPSVKLRREPEIHGEVTLMAAAGSHDYSAYGGAVALTYEDPENNFALSVGYSEVRSKGGRYYGSCLDDFRHRGPFSPFGDPFDRRW